MFRKKIFFLLGLIFSLLFSLSCDRKTKKTQGAASSEPSITKFEYASSTKSLKVGETSTFSVKGGIPPLRFSTTLGNISLSGLYTAQYAGEGYVIVTDSANNKIFIPIKVYAPLSVAPTFLTLVPNKSYKFSASGGVPPYSFTSKNGSMNLNTGDYIAPSTIGEEIISVSDSTGDKVYSYVTINPDLEIKPANITLTKNGELTFSIYGGVPPYSLSATLGTINSNGVYYSPSNEGTGVVTVKDRFGNTATSNVTIISGLGINTSRINLLINSSYPFKASGGFPPYSYSASVGKINSSTGDYTTPSIKGSATITVLDSMGKTQTAEVNIFEPLKISPAEKTLAVGNNFRFLASEGVPPYEFFTDIGTIDSASGYFTAPINAGEAKVTVIDQENNKFVAIVTINSKLSLSPTSIKLGANNNYRFIASGGVPPYKYGALAGIIGENGDYTAPSTAGQDTITLTDDQGNKAVSDITINPKLEFADSSKTMRPGEYFTFVPTGGVPPYTFSANFGVIDYYGLYKFPEGIDWDEVTVTDSLGEIATVTIKGDFKDFWTWMAGTDSINMESNNTPGGKYGSASWTDKDGNFWLFSGAKRISDIIIYNNELWKYDTNLNRWIPVPPKSSDFPKGRYYPSSWSDFSGNLWLFGGGAYGGGGPTSESVGLNDLWKFNPTGNEWTLMSGSTSPNQPGVYDGENQMPGSRLSALSWTQSGNLWLFGGWGKANPGYLNDLWKYNIDIGKWIFVKGGKSPSQHGVYGGFRIPSQNNMPGARAYAVSWIDKEEKNLWLFGGYGYSASGDKGFLNDLWKFDTERKEWTWMGGSNSVNGAGNYGKIGEASINNVPGAKRSAFGWADKSGNFWLFGGRQETTLSYLVYNDLWKYNIGTKQWTWVSGSNLANQNGNYGRMGVTVEKNVPGSRESGACWIDKAENLWLFGGYGKNSSSYGHLNDLWKFITK